MKSLPVPNEVYFGVGAIQKLKTLKGRCKHVFIVTDKNIIEAGLLKKVTDVLNSVEISYFVYDGVEPDPTRRIIEKGVKCIEKEGISPDWIIGLGGGSCIDSGKVIRIFYEYPDITWERIVEPRSDVPPLGNKCRFIGISTTSGTGSEVSFGSVVTNDTVEPHSKQCIIHTEQIPDMAIADPELAVGMPPEVTASTGIDALIHGIEGYTAKNADDFTSPLSLHAATMIFKNLPHAYKKGTDLEAREQVHTAQMFASMCFANSGLGLAHAMGLALGAKYGVPHGTSCSVPMPYVMKFNGQACAKKYADLCRAFEIDCYSEEDAVKKLIEAFISLEKEINLPLTIRELGVTEEQFNKDLDDLVKLTEEQVDLLRTNPKTPTTEECMAIFKDTYYGKV